MKLGNEGERLAHAAEQFVGAPFRLHGRDPRTGLDCVGLVYASLLAIGFKPRAPEGYALRNADPRRWFAHAGLSGLTSTHGTVRPGDVFLTSPSPGQFHLAISSGRATAIHAHAGLRRVVRQPMTLTPVASGHWRLPQRTGD